MRHGHERHRKNGDESLIEPGMADEPVIEARDLRKWFRVRRGLARPGPQTYLRAVDGISFRLRAGEVLGLVGESGCGKSTAGMTLLNLYTPTSGEIVFDGLGRIDGADRRTLLAFRRQARSSSRIPMKRSTRATRSNKACASR